MDTAYALAFATYSAAQTFNILALFLRFDNDGTSISIPCATDAYGIYLIHYIPVLWLQYALLRHIARAGDASERDPESGDRLCR